MIDLSDFREVYLEELEEQLQTLEQEILALERDGGSDAGIQRMFRAAHTLKGSSAAMGFERMKLLTHEMEHFLDKIRNREASVTAALIDIFFACLDRMKCLQAEIVEHNEERSAIGDLVSKLGEMHLAYGEEAPQVPKPARPDIPRDVLASLPEARAGENALTLVRVRLAEDAVMKLARLNVIASTITELGVVFWQEPDPCSQLEEDRIQEGLWLIASALEDHEIGRIVGALSDVAGVELEAFIPQELQDEAQSPNGRDTAAHPEPVAGEPGEKYKSSTIRVNVDRLEQLMNYVGELVIEQTRIQQAEKSFRRRYGSDEAIEELSDIADHLTRIVGELQESVMKVRMLPIDQLFSRFPRMIRDLSQSLHKEVEFVLEGKETELDRTLIEEIGDPLIHLIRNAIDHGIETPDIRRTAGKPERGRIHVRAAHEDNQIAITVTDDGAGMDPAKLRRAAVSKGMMSAGQSEQLSDHEALHLIFQPGFSTAPQLSEVSGRGVGMDIVRTDIERLNGLIEIETKLGRGTTFKIKLPLTLAIITGLLVKIGSRTFIAPMSNVAEIVRVEPSAIRRVKGIPVILLRDEIIPVIWPHDYFGCARPRSPNRFIPIVVIGRAEKRLALAVDELLGNQEVVIKTLGSYVGQMDGIAGATVLGDGSVALILEAGGMMKLVNDRGIAN